MAKRRSRQDEEPLLFDLPLQEEEEGEDWEEALDREAEPERRRAVEDDEAPAGDGEDDLAGEPESPSAERAAAPVVDRLLAGLADLAIQALVAGAAVAGVLAMGLRPGLEDWQPFAAFSLLFSFLYWVIPLAFWGQTPGMTWIGHLARSESEEPLAFGQTVRRWLGALLTLALAGLPLLLAAFGGRSLSDRLSGSRTTTL